MKIVIVGAGTVGSNLAKTLSEEGHKVYVIEGNKKIAQKADEKLDVKVILGQGADPDVLKSATVGDADLVIAVTDSDETNMVVCSLASAFGATQRIARVRNTSLSASLGEFGYKRFYIDEIINPEEVAAQSIVKTLQTPGAKEVVDFADGRILLRSFDVPKESPLCGSRIDELKDEDFPWPFLIIAIMRNNKVIIPKGDVLIEESDRVYVLLPATSTSEFLTFVNPAIRKPKKVIIYGSTDIGTRVARSLCGSIGDIVLLEEDAEAAEVAAGELAGVTVINGAGTEADILKESGVEAADVFIASTDNDHLNLVSAVLAKKMGAKITIITTQQPDYMAIMDALDIDAIINPRFLAVDQILKFVRGEGISSITKLIGSEAEAIELVPEEGAPVTRAPIKEITFPKNSIVGAVCNEKEVKLVHGDTHIKAGDSVIVFCQDSSAKKLQEMFTHKKIF